ncbi:MAG TPA: lytic transglycosylase domain-containing protein [Longimicrobiales bacterium]
MTPLIATLIEEAGRVAGLEAAFVGAIVQVESEGYPYAGNPEPRYRYLWDVRRNRPFRALTPEEIASEFPPDDWYDLRGWHGRDADAEWWWQQASIGLMQVMGAVAREEGFTAVSLLELCDPAANLTVGCRHLRRLVLWADGNLEMAAAAYNAGRGGWDSAAGQAYAQKVLRAIAQMRLTGLPRGGDR